MRLSYHLFAASTALSVGASYGNRFSFGIKNFAGTFTRTSEGKGVSSPSSFLGITSTRGGDQETGSSDGNSATSAPTGGDGDVNDIMLNEISLTQEEEDAIKAQEEAFPDVVPTASDVGEHELEPGHDHLTSSDHDASIDDIDNYDEATTNILLQEVDDGDYVDDISAGTDDDFSAMVDDDDNDEAGNTRMDYSNTTIDDEGDFSEDQSPSLSGESSASGATTIQVDNQEEEGEELMEEEEPLKTNTSTNSDNALMTNEEENTLSSASTIIDKDGNDNENINTNVDEDVMSHYGSDRISHSDLQEEGNDDEDGHGGDDDNRVLPDSALDMENDEDLLTMMDDSDGDIFNVDIVVETDYPSFSDDSAACVDRMDLADAYDDEVLLTDNEAAAEVEVEVEADAEADAELAVEAAAELSVEAVVEASAESQIMLEEADTADVDMVKPDLVVDVDVDVEEEQAYEYSEEEIAEIEESIPNISELVSDDKIAPSVVQKGTTVNYVITENMRRLLVRKLGYKAAEVQNMKPDVAAVLVHKMLKRPKTGMPEQFYVDDAAHLAPKTKMWGAKRILAGDFLRKAVVPLVSVLLIAVSSLAVKPKSKDDNSNSVNALPVSSQKAAVSASKIPKLVTPEAALPTPNNDKKSSAISIKPVEAILKNITKPKAKKTPLPAATKVDEAGTANQSAEVQPDPAKIKSPKKEGILRRVKQSVSKKESVAFAPSVSSITSNKSISESSENISSVNIDQEDESLELLETMLPDVEDLDKTIVDKAITFTLEKVDEVLKRPF